VSSSADSRSPPCKKAAFSFSCVMVVVGFGLNTATLPRGLTNRHLYFNDSGDTSENSLGQRFVAVKGTDVLFCIWETRVKDYEVFRRETRRSKDSAGFSQGETHPAVMISWEDAALFCSWLTARELKSGKIPEGAVYRLPTSKEWSLAVGLAAENPDPLQFSEGPSQTEFPWEGPWPPPVSSGNYHPDLGVDSFSNTSPVGSFNPNQYGIYDLGGNVWEWCSDAYKNSIDFRVLRGASWRMRSPGDLLSSMEIGNVSHLRLSTYGFRVVLALPKKAATNP
jgi:formylglycine-generating enzyme required for sulfatase activity